MLGITLSRKVATTPKQRRIIVERRKTQDQGKTIEVTVDRTIDARGAYCPGPLMELIIAVKAAPVGSIIEVLSSVSGSAKEIPYWAAKLGHEHLGTEENKGYWSILVRKGSSEDSD